MSGVLTEKRQNRGPNLHKSRNTAPSTGQKRSLHFLNMYGNKRDQAGEANAFRNLFFESYLYHVYS